MQIKGFQRILLETKILLVYAQVHTVSNKGKYNWEEILKINKTELDHVQLFCHTIRSPIISSGLAHCYADKFVI
jgi:hypothetical protein